MTAIEWLAYQLVSYYSSSLDAISMRTQLYDFPLSNMDWAIRWEAGERDELYDDLPEGVVKFLGLEPL